MSIISWTGNASAIAQVDSFSPTNPVPGDTFNIICDGKTVSYVEGSAATVADVCAGLLAALQSSTFPEFLEAGWTNPASVAVFSTAVNAGTPLTFTVSLVKANLAVPTLGTPTVTTGGTLTGSTTYYYVLTATLGGGETTKSVEVSGLTTSGNKTINLAWTQVPGATGYNLYRTTSSGTYGGTSLLTSISGGSTITYIDNGGTSLTSGSPPVSNTAQSTATFTHAVATANGSPNDVNNTANYSTGALPTGGDTLNLQDTSVSLLYNLSSLSAVALAALNIYASFTGQIGLPNVNPNGYEEYRPKYFSIQVTTTTIGYGTGQGSSLVKLNLGSGTASTVNVYSTGSATNDGLPALLIIGTNSSNIINVLGNGGASIGIAAEANQSATFATVRASGTNTSILFGSGATLTTVTNTGGNLDVSSAITTLTQHSGQTTLRAGADGTVTINGGTVIDLSASTITTLVVAPSGKMDLSGDLRPKTITTTTILAGATLLDPYSRVTWTNGITLSQCRIADVSIDVGINLTITP